MEKENKERSDYSNLYPPFGSSQYITASSLPPRRIWTELLGATVEEAQNKIKEDMPEAQIEVLGFPYAMLQSFCDHRVRILVDSYGKVVQSPEVGDQPMARSIWTELVGLTVEETQNKIKEDMRGLRFKWFLLLTPPLLILGPMGQNLR